MFAGINDIIHGWTTNTVIFPKACKEHYSLLSTFLWIIKEDISCVFTADEQLGALKEICNWFSQFPHLFTSVIRQ